MKNGEKPKYVVTKGNKHDTMTMKIKLCTERSWALQDMIASIAYIPRSHKRSESAKKVRLFSSPAGTDFGTTWRKSCKKQMKNKSPKGYPFVCYFITNKGISLCLLWNNKQRDIPLAIYFSFVFYRISVRSFQSPYLRGLKINAPFLPIRIACDFAVCMLCLQSYPAMLNSFLCIVLFSSSLYHAYFLLSPHILVFPHFSWVFMCFSFTMTFSHRFHWISFP